MRIAFVGIEKDWEDLKVRDYVYQFVKHHLELPFYYCRDGGNSVDIWTNIDKAMEVDNDSRCSSAPIQVRPNSEWSGGKQYDIVIHWRKWLEPFYSKNAINVINSQDHSYSVEWLQKVQQATKDRKLKGILCFPEWHQNRLNSELNIYTHKPSLFAGVTLGVDTQVYRPSENKNPHELLWASDIGRGLFNGSFLSVVADLFKRDQSIKANVCYPDYTDSYNLSIGHPAIKLHKNLDNGPELWNLFNTCGFLPYTSTFTEPSSRAHRQAMASGCVVLYPPNMGTPSDLLTDNVDGFVRPVSEWVDIITTLIEDEDEFNRISKNAREHAVRENWEAQSKRFNRLFEGLLNDD